MRRVRSGVAALVLALVAVGCSSPDAARVDADASSTRPSATPSSASSSTAAPTPSATPPLAAPPAPPAPPAAPALLPNGTRSIFDTGDFLVAYYGTAGTPALGVLGEDPPDVADRRLRAAARPFKRPGHRVQRVYELIVTIADRHPGPGRDYNHDLSRAQVQTYIDAAHRNGALLLLDLQPGRSGFLEVAKRWEWALKDPWVGLALDPEWRMGRRQVPGRTIGGVDAREVNRTSAWLAQLRREHRLPQKLFVLHQFRDSMIRRIGAVQDRPGLAMVQHVDGFGTPGQKLATYRAVARPAQFTMGFKLFYDEDVRRLRAPQVRAIRPKVRFVSFQ